MKPCPGTGPGHQSILCLQLIHLFIVQDESSQGMVQCSLHVVLLGFFLERGTEPFVVDPANVSDPERAVLGFLAQGHGRQSPPFHHKPYPVPGLEQGLRCSLKDPPWTAPQQIFVAVRGSRRPEFPEGTRRIPFQQLAHDNQLARYVGPIQPRRGCRVEKGPAGATKGTDVAFPLERGRNRAALVVGNQAHLQNLEIEPIGDRSALVHHVIGNVGQSHRRIKVVARGCRGGRARQRHFDSLSAIKDFRSGGEIAWCCGDIRQRREVQVLVHG
mmetsp:Transcript_7752/g.22720  ORF Transcript_7752/g.22720 Transcript_7752/m.22720 type:complete len:272 (+) Transcript_7752:2969-3784(+)